MSERVIAYIDGFNLYWGLRSKGWRKYYWLNLRTMCEKLLKPSQNLVVVKYYTSRVKNNSVKIKRQSIYLDALRTMPKIELYFGKYQFSPIKCTNCGYINNIPEEKMTDVQLASMMVSDAYRNKYDAAFLISGDIDLVPSIEIIRSEFENKRVVAVFPPMRRAQELCNVVHAHIHVTEQVLKESQLPEEIAMPGGYILKRPSEWI